MILKNSLLGFGRRLAIYIKIVVTIYTETYRVYPGDFMIDDSENKDFARIKYCVSENKLVARLTSNE